MQHKHDVDITKHDARDYVVDCYQCGKSFGARRSDAAFCSTRCRVANSREPQKKANAIEDLRYSGVRAKEIAEKYPHSEEVFQAMLKLQAEVMAALRTFEEKPAKLPGF